MTSHRARTILSLTMVAVLGVLVSFRSEAAVGTIRFIKGEVTHATAGNAAQPARQGTAVNVGDVFTTADDAMAQIAMVDGAMLSIRPRSQIRIENYPSVGSGKKLMMLLYGGLRALTRKFQGGGGNGLSIRTDTAVIGVRGTDHEVYHVRVENGPSGAQPGTYDRVYRGGTYMSTASGRIELNEKQVGYAERQDRPPVLLDTIPDFLAMAPTKPPVKLAEGRNGDAMPSSGQGGLTGTTQPFTSTNLDLALTPLATMQSIGGTVTFSNIINQSQPVTETGALGGKVTAFATSINFSTLTLTGFSLAVTDAANRNWIASSTIPAPISAGGTFDKVFIPTSCAGCTYLPTNSTISMVVQGSTGGSVLAVYDLQAVGTVTESVKGTVSAAR